MTDWEKRAALHKIFDLVLDINGMEGRYRDLTGDNKPTAFLKFFGHTAEIEVWVYENGWNFENKEKPRTVAAYLDGSDCRRELHQMIEELEKEKLPGSGNLPGSQK